MENIKTITLPPFSIIIPQLSKDFKISCFTYTLALMVGGLMFRQFA